MNIRFYNARILTMAADEKIQQGELWVEGNRITRVAGEDRAAPGWDREIDAAGNLLMPGFKNAHTARMIGGPGMSIDEIRKLSGYELDYGVTTDLVPTIMRNVFGNQYFGNVNDGSHNPYKGLLDTNSIIITNYPVVVDGKTFAHAVVIVGYVETGNGPKYTCLDPGTGEYIYKTATDLYWFLNSNKFTVAVKKYN